MRLLNTRTLRVENCHKNVPKYAILSHTWGIEECTLQDMEAPNFSSRAGYEKIESCCEQALKDGLDWAWIDT
jgi:hypothetical protein